MKNKSMLDLMGNIDDSFIEEAAHPEILSKIKHRKRMLLVKKIGTLAACMVIALGMVVAVPYMNVNQETTADMELLNSAMDAVMDSVLQDSDAHTDVSKSSAAGKAEAENSEDFAISSAVAADKEAFEDALEKAQEEAESAKNAAEEASKAAAEASKEASQAAFTTNLPMTTAAKIPETEMPAEMTSAAMMFSETIQGGNGEIFEYLDHVIYRLSADGIALEHLMVPQILGGEPMIELAVSFWNFVPAHPELKTVTIPETIEIFGDVSLLEKSVVIICPEGSPAAIFFAQAGYTVQFQ